MNSGQSVVHLSRSPEIHAYSYRTESIPLTPQKPVALPPYLALPPTKTEIYRNAAHFQESTEGSTKDLGFPCFLGMHYSGIEITEVKFSAVF